MSRNVIGLSIREVSEDDIPAILEIERETIFPPWTHGALLSEIYNQDSYFIKAEKNGAVLGFAILRRAADEAELLQIAVSRNVQRMGAAGALMLKALEWAASAGVISIYLEVRKSNEAAAGLYKKHGFVSVRIRKNYYEDPVEDAVVMELKRL